MKSGDIALLAAAAAAVYLVINAKRSGKSLMPSSWVPWKSITTYDGNQYFTDGQSGLVIDSQGRYVLNGEVVWSPPGLF